MAAYEKYNSMYTGIQKLTSEVGLLARRFLEFINHVVHMMTGRTTFRAKQVQFPVWHHNNNESKKIIISTTPQNYLLTHPPILLSQGGLVSTWHVPISLSEQNHAIIIKNLQ
jgi:hypothetical protein